MKYETLLHILNSVSYDSQDYAREALTYFDVDSEISFNYSELFEAADKVCATLCSISVENKVVAVALGTSHHAIPSIVLGYIHSLLL